VSQRLIEGHAVKVMAHRPRQFRLRLAGGGHRLPNQAEAGFRGGHLIVLW
jgi:hypothetical protein